MNEIGGVDFFRDPHRVQALAGQIAQRITRPWVVMEVCGGQTHSIVRNGLDRLLPDQLELIHGPGCPVCVTPVEVIDQARQLVMEQELLLCTFGDMLRVPGSDGDLLSVGSEPMWDGQRARGGQVRMVYSPLDALQLARDQPQRQVVFLAVGFETTAPAVATAALQAHQTGVKNFTLLVSHVRVPPALEAILGSADNRVQGVLAAGHVCVIEGLAAYHELAARYAVPMVVTGFEPVDILDGLLGCVEQLERGAAAVENRYQRAASADGNGAARALVEQLFEPADFPWRGFGPLPLGGLQLRAEYSHLDAQRRFGLQPLSGKELCSSTQQPQPVAEQHGGCRAGAVLRGEIKPTACPLFGGRCSPQQPQGAPMVSSEGACAAYYHYRLVSAGEIPQDQQ